MTNSHVAKHGNTLAASGDDVLDFLRAIARDDGGRKESHHHQRRNEKRGK